MTQRDKEIMTEAVNQKSATVINLIYQFIEKAYDKGYVFMCLYDIQAYLLRVMAADENFKEDFDNEQYN